MRTLLALLLFAGFASGQSVKLPPEIKGEPGSFITIPAETDSAEVQWLVLDPGLNPFPVELLKSSKVFVATTLKPGRYRVFAYVGKGDKASPPVPTAICMVIVGDAPPVPPGPNPPTPIPPTPDDGKFGLVKASREGLAKVNSNNRANEAKKLAEANKSLASKIAAGAIPTPAAILDECRVVNRGALNNDEILIAVWGSWRDNVSPVLQKAYKDGKFPSNSAWADAFNEIAKGLE